MNPLDIWMKPTRAHTQYFTRLLQPLFFSLSPPPPLSSLPPPLSFPNYPLLALPYSLKCLNQSIFTEAISQSSYLFASFYRNHITETKSPKPNHWNCNVNFNWKKFADNWNWTRVPSVQKRVWYPFGHAEPTKFDEKNVLLVWKREWEERESVWKTCLFIACAAVFVCCLRSGVHLLCAGGVGSFLRLQWQERKIETKKDSAFLPVE